jgi:hypothetical protein
MDINQHDERDKRLAGDALVGAKQIAEFITSLGVPTDEDDVTTRGEQRSCRSASTVPS